MLVDQPFLKTRAFLSAFCVFVLGIAIAKGAEGPADAKGGLAPPGAVDTSARIVIPNKLKSLPSTNATGEGPPTANGAPFPTYITMTVEQWMEFAKRYGFVDLEFAERPEPNKRRIDGKLNNIPASIVPYDCSESGACTGVEFHAFFGKQSPTLKFVSAFNDNHFSRLVTYDDGTLQLVHFINFSDGASSFHISNAMRLFISELKEAIDFKP